MSQSRRGFALLIRGGDAEISGAIAEGMLSGGGDLIRQPFGLPPFHGPSGPVSLETAHCAVSRALDAPEGEGFGNEEDARRARVVREEIERQRDAEARRAEVVRQRAREAARRAAIRRHTPQEWAAMTAQARFDYGQDPEPGKLARALTAIYGLLCYALARAYRAQAIVLEGETCKSRDTGSTTSRAGRGCPGW